MYRTSTEEPEICAPFVVGQRVSAVRYGAEREYGTVTRAAQVGRSALTDGRLVWVQFDGKRETWMHAISLRVE